jgi:hypothetical protein
MVWNKKLKKNKNKLKIKIKIKIGCHSITKLIGIEPKNNKIIFISESFSGSNNYQTLYLLSGLKSKISSKEFFQIQV